MRRLTHPAHPATLLGRFPRKLLRPQPQLSPQSAYEQATRPLEITRRLPSINWSDSETAALAVAVKQAKEQCSSRTPSQYTGEDLIAYARLCALGQQWPTVQEAADPLPPRSAHGNATDNCSLLTFRALPRPMPT